MRCPSCVRQVDDALRTLTGVGAVEVRLREGTVSVRHDPNTTVHPMFAALRAAGDASSLAAAA